MTTLFTNRAGYSVVAIWRWPWWGLAIALVLIVILYVVAAAPMWGITFYFVRLGYLPPEIMDYVDILYYPVIYLHQVFPPYAEFIQWEQQVFDRIKGTDDVTQGVK